MDDSGDEVGEAVHGVSTNAMQHLYVFLLGYCPMMILIHDSTLLTQSLVESEKLAVHKLTTHVGRSIFLPLDRLYHRKRPITADGVSQQATCFQVTLSTVTPQALYHYRQQPCRGYGGKRQPLVEGWVRKNGSAQDSRQS